MLSIILAILGAAVVTAVVAHQLPGYRRRKAAARRSREISGEQALEDYLSKIEKAASPAELDRLDRNHRSKER